VRISWYDEAAGRKRGNAIRRAWLCGEYRIFVRPKARLKQIKK
jgi:hypothetical protein